MASWEQASNLLLLLAVFNEGQVKKLNWGPPYTKQFELGLYIADIIQLSENYSWVRALQLEKNCIQEHVDPIKIKTY